MKRGRCIRNTPWPALVATVLAATALCCSCTDRDDRNSCFGDRLISRCAGHWDARSYVA